MAEKVFTEEQLQAIETKGKTLLVSAAAGSGKTAVLTERILRTLMDPEHPVDLSEMLIVTFTNAAVAEMRKRIFTALSNAVTERGGDRRLERMLLMLPTAKIMTIDAFCNSLLHECAAEAGLPAGYRIAEKAETELLRQTLMEDLIESVYDGNLGGALTPARFAALADCLTGVKNEATLAERLAFLYERTESEERGVALLSDLSAEYASFTRVEDTKTGALLLLRTREMLTHYIDAYEARIADLRSDPTPQAGKIADLFSAEREEMCAVLSRADGYAACREALTAFAFPTLPPVRKGDKTDAVCFAKMTRDAFKADRKKYLTEYFSYTEEEWKDLYAALFSVQETLTAFLTAYDRIYRAEKRRRGIVEYTDIERYTCEALWKDGERTPFALAVADRFAAVYIDEYQDVSPLQAHIFDAVTREDNCFSVGDIKQSIYGFRGADPSVFAHAKETYPPLADADGHACATVFMSKNFRSDPAVIDFVNGVFDPTFSLLGESIGYRPEDRLTAGKSGAPTYHKAEILLLEQPARGGENAEEDEETPPFAREAEARALALRVRELLTKEKKNDGTPYRPGEIAVLSRKQKGVFEVYAKALAELDIPVEIVEEKYFFFNAEVLLVLSLLNVIDNPRRDIHLAGLLCSPLFGFTPDDLALLRKEGEGRTLYDALLSYTAAHPTFAHGHAFLDRLAHFRHMAEGVGIDRLLSRLYAETGLEALAAKNGGGDNLRLFYEYARRFEASSYKGLYGFIHYINRLIESGKTFDSHSTAESSDRVKLLTVHAAKGLEYPVCFLVEAGARSVNTAKIHASPLLFSKSLGVGLRLRDAEGLVYVENPIRTLIANEQYRAETEEELRVLYVALTRPKERLFIVGRVGCKGGMEEFSERMRYERECASPYSAAKRKSYLELILASGASAKITVLTPARKDEAEPQEEKEPLCEAAPSAPAREPAYTEETVREYVSRFTYRYPAEALCRIPAKLAVSLLSPSVLDGNEEEEERLDIVTEAERARRISTVLHTKVGIAPRFITGNDQKESAKRGIATHHFLQFCDFARLAAQGVDAELSRMTEQRFLSAEETRLVRREELCLFADSALLGELLAAREMWREFRFHAKLPAKDFTTDPALASALGEEQLFIQGVMDVLYRDARGRLCLIDYKTDRLPEGALANEALARDILAEKHHRQLSYYAAAIRKIFGAPPDVVGLYSLPLGKTLFLTL